MAEIHEVALMFKKLIHVTCINLVGITCENCWTTTDFRIHDLPYFHSAQWRGHGWVWVGSNPPTFKKGTHEIFANPKTFLGVGVRGEVRGGLREKKHELCQIVLNKQQHIYSMLLV